VEITETAALQNIEEAARFVDALRHAGCRVALDDFGAGHTSLRQLQTLAVDTVKVDRSLIGNIADREEKRLVLHDLLALIKSFGLTTVAEGVESAEVAAMVRAVGFGYLQGYHLGPRPSSALGSALRRATLPRWMRLGLPPLLPAKGSAAGREERMGNFDSTSAGRIARTVTHADKARANLNRRRQRSGRFFDGVHVSQADGISSGERLTRACGATRRTPTKSVAQTRCQ
jgi:hypothetical protein